ncbi:MAG: hypothetical protein LBL52_02105, partial [Rickettsiales bacterium]|nr:hypothetical protein [Rickettsiales bacterium]
SRDDVSKTLRKISGFDNREKEYKDYAASVDARLTYLTELKDKFPADYSTAYDREQYSSSEDELAALTKLKDDLKKRQTLTPPPFDSVFIFGDDINDVIMIGSTLLYFDVRPENARFIGTSQLANSKVYAERALKGAVFPLASTKYSAKFDFAFEKYFGRAPNKLASLAYDAVALLASLPEPTAAEIASPDGFAGINGAFRFMGAAAERNMDIMEIVGGTKGAKVVSPASARFMD